jgi:hypothetical protein
MLLITCIVTAQCWAQGVSLAAPKTIRRYLDRNYRGWKAPAIASEWKQYFAARKDGTVPHLVKGDFDGNGLSDYAVLIVQPESGQTGMMTNKRRRVIVFLASRRGYRPLVISNEPYSPENYLGLARKGEQDYNIGAQRMFKYKTDAFVVIHAEKTAKSYVYRKGRFHLITTGD